MKYMLLFCRDQSRYEALTEDQRKDLHTRYHDYGVKVIKSGQMSSGEALQPTAMATRVRVRAGKRQLTDGPFAETVEALLGFAVVECENLDEAIEWAAAHPDAEMGVVEVRPVLSWSVD